MIDGTWQVSVDFGSDLCRNCVCHELSQKTRLVSSVVVFRYMFGEDTPLHVAAQTGHSDVARALLEKGAEVNLKNARGDTPLLNAFCPVWRGKTPRADCFFNQACRNSENALQDMVKLLLAHGADVNIADVICKETPLHQAARHGHTRVVCELIKSGAWVNVQNEEDDTPLLLALQQPQGERNTQHVVQALLQAGADPNMVGAHGRSPLQQVDEDYEDFFVYRLIKAGADVNKADENGMTPLVTLGWNLQAQLMLIEAGADVNRLDNWGWSPLANLLDLSRPVSHALLDAGARIVPTRGLPYKVFHTPLLHNIRLLKLVLKCEVDVRDDPHLSPLAVKPDPELQQWALAAGASSDDWEVSNLFQLPADDSLLGICRSTIRRHLMDIGRVNLFHRVKELPLPPATQKYLVYSMPLE